MYRRQTEVDKCTYRRQTEVDKCTMYIRGKQKLTNVPVYEVKKEVEKCT